jgi:hypothetical protein
MCVCVFVVSGYYINQPIFLNWINDWTGEAETRWQLNPKMLEVKKKQLKIKSCASFTVLFFFTTSYYPFKNPEISSFPSVLFFSYLRCRALKSESDMTFGLASAFFFFKYS